ncbi:MAG: YbhB/YbcL family Raf kinase inhibitor-like protein [Cetobacterium sp.]|uniref:YbhB/YbcL family Raf kinase inhibitor-like protein n=1 Tax=Cetobacterium sp. TaxID=2071632 RepID=UPI003F2B0424
MKTNILTVLTTISISSFGFSLESNGIKNGYIQEKYGKHGTQNLNGMPSLSIPLKWNNAPKNTKSYALVMEDFDAIPVTGFSWIHWVSIIPANITELKENASLENKNIIQGVNSWVSTMGGLSKSDASHFGGPAPPDKDHTYSITLYALDKNLNLESGFYLNELYKEIEGHVLDKVTLKGIYKK